MTPQWIDNLETGKDKPPESLHKQGVASKQAELRTETRRIQRRQQRLQPPAPPIWIELIEWDDWHQQTPATPTALPNPFS